MQSASAANAGLAAASVNVIARSTATMQVTGGFLVSNELLRVISNGRT
jgi:hypothetical protein